MQIQFKQFSLIGLKSFLFFILCFLILMKNNTNQMQGRKNVLR